MKKTFFLLLLLLISAPGVWAMGSTKDDPAEVEPIIVGHDRDAHGCIGSAGYTWSEEQKECIRVFEVEASGAPSHAPEDTAVCAYPELIGKNIKDVDTKAYFPGRAVRVLPPGAMATMDYSATRLNIHTDEDGVIKMFACG